MAAAAIGGAVLLSSGDDSPPGPSGPTEGGEAQVLEQVGIGPLGIAAEIPQGWSSARKSGTLNLESGDRCVAVALSAPVGSSQAGSLRETSIEALRRSLGRIEVRRSQGGRVSGLPTSGALIAVRNKRGDPVVIQLSVSRGEERAYLTQLVFRRPPCADAAAETRAVIASLEFRD